MSMTHQASQGHGAHAAAPNSAARKNGRSAEVPEDRAVQIAAARLRLVTDRRLGKATPEWVKSLAAEKPKR
jgi:hypothetical protein